MAALSKEELFERLRKHEGYIYNQPQITIPRYLDHCYEYIMEHCVDVEKKELKNIKKISRLKSYKVKRAAKTESQRSGRGEEWFVLDLFLQKTDKEKVFGELPEFGYQVPIKNSQQDKGAGKIDFISVMFDGYLYLHEIKADYSRESILKAILEVQTYFQQIDHDKLIDDFGLKVKGIKKSIVLFEKSYAYQQVNDKKVQYLLDLFDIKIIGLSNSNIFKQINS